MNLSICVCCPIFVEQIPQELRWRKAVFVRVLCPSRDWEGSKKATKPYPRASTFPILSHRSGSLQIYALSNFERLSSINVKKSYSTCKIAKHARPLTTLSNLCTLSRRKIYQLYCVFILTENLTYRFSWLSGPVMEGKRKKRLVYALCNLYLIIFIRNINNK